MNGSEYQACIHFVRILVNCSVQTFPPILTAKKTYFNKYVYEGINNYFLGSFISLFCLYSFALVAGVKTGIV